MTSAGYKPGFPSPSLLSCLSLVLLILGGCQTGHKELPVGMEGEEDVRIQADGYVFNARLWRDGKPTSFKLELYVTDTLVGIYARGYLGKGAFKGWLTSDSIKLYFPSSKELIHESLDDLVKNADCGVSIAGIKFLSLFDRTPDSVPMPPGVRVAPDSTMPYLPFYCVASESPDCPWRMDLQYDDADDRYNIAQILFDNGRGIKLRASLERRRYQVRVPLKRFQVSVPADAIRIIP